MFYLNQEVIGSVDNIDIYGGKCEDFIDVWGLIEDKNHFFSDFDEINSKEDFKRFYDQAIYDVCVARKNGEIIYASWIVISGWKSFYYCGVSAKDHRQIKLTKKLSNVAIKYFTGKYNINRFDALVIHYNRVSRFCLYRLGFKCLGKIPKYLQIKGSDTDYYQYYLEV